MAQHQYSYQPTLRHILSSETLSEAQVVSGQDLLDRPVTQVVSGLSPTLKAGSLLVTRPEALENQDLTVLGILAGLIVVRPVATPTYTTSAAGSSAASNKNTETKVNVQAAIEVGLEGVIKLCKQLDLPLIVLPSFGELSQATEDVRQTFLVELKRKTSQWHSHLISHVISDGLNGLVDELHKLIGRPIAIETTDFAILAAHDMTQMSAGKQRTFVKEQTEEINRALRAESDVETDNILRPFKIGRRLVTPISLDKSVVGYLSIMVRPTDDVDSLTELLMPAVIACMVDFSQRKKELVELTHNQKQSLLKDILSGQSHSSSEQERLERSFGFDLCDGLLVFAVNVLSNTNQPASSIAWPQDIYTSAEVEGTRVFVIPYNKKASKTWREEADRLVAVIKKNNTNIKVQLGAGRMADTMLDLADTYREARQALIIGSMLTTENEFSLGYGELGVKRLLYLMFDHPELDRFYEENLAPLEVYDAEWESELIPTLEVYLKHGANLNSAARALYIHRHTLRYRLEQIADILKVDIDSQEILLNLQIAFLIKEMKGKTLS